MDGQGRTRQHTGEKPKQGQGSDEEKGKEESGGENTNQSEAQGFRVGSTPDREQGRK